MTVYQLLSAWLEPVHQITGLSGVESFWTHSVLLSVEVFCVVGFMVWAFSQLSSYAVSSDKPSLRTAISSAMLVAYVFVLGLSMLLFFDHEQILKPLNQGAVPHVYVAAAFAFFLLAWSPVLYFQRRSEHLDSYDQPARTSANPRRRR